MSPYIIFCRWLVVLVLFSLGIRLLGGLKASPEFFEALPSSTVGLVYVDDLSKEYEFLQHGSLTRLWEKDELATFFAPLLDFTIHEEESLFWQQLQGYFSQRVLLALSSIETGSQENEAWIPRGLLLADFKGGRAAFEAFIQQILVISRQSADQLENPQLIKNTYRNASLYSEKQSSHAIDGHPLVFGLVDRKIAIIGQSTDEVKNAIDRLQGIDGSQNLAELPHFKKAYARIGRMNAFGYMNLGALVKLAEAAIKVADSHFQNNPLISLQGMFKALALSELETLFVAKDSQKKETVFYSGLLFKDRRGVIPLLTNVGSEPLKNPHFVPKEAISSTIRSFNLGRFYKDLENVFYRAVPVFAGLYQGYLYQLKIRSGIDIKEAVFSNFGEQWTQFSIKESMDSEGKLGLNTLYILPIKNREEMETTIQKVKANLNISSNHFIASPYRDASLYVFLPKDSQSHPFSYAFTDKNLVLGISSIAALKASIDRLEQNKSKESLWHQKKVKKALASKFFPKGAIGRNYTDLSTWLQMGLTQLAQLQEISPPEKKICNPHALPKPPERSHFLVGQTYLEDNGLFSRHRLLEVER